MNFEQRFFTKMFDKWLKKEFGEVNRLGIIYFKSQKDKQHFDKYVKPRLNNKVIIRELSEEIKFRLLENVLEFMAPEISKLNYIELQETINYSESYIDRMTVIIIPDSQGPSGYSNH